MIRHRSRVLYEVNLSVCAHVSENYLGQEGNRRIGLSSAVGDENNQHDQLLHGVACRLELPYSGNLSRMKTFANFAVSGQFAKVFTAKTFIKYGGVIIDGRVIVVSRNYS